MTALLAALLLLGLLPFGIGAARLRNEGRFSLHLGEVLICALAFNLTFFWQELWLVIPKALTPGLHPVLFHNNHDWTGDAPKVELLQGTGAVATLISGLAFLAAARVRRTQDGWRLFLFWMAAQGLYQSLTQIFLGTILTGNDTGRALAYLGVGRAGDVAIGLTVIGAMFMASLALAAHRPAAWTRPAALGFVATALASILVVIPFREPRNLIEVAWVPLFVNLTAAGFVVLAASLRRESDEARGPQPSTPWKTPALALAGVLAVFQGVLRHGIAF
jgi:hypothetical protein